MTRAAPITRLESERLVLRKPEARDWKYATGFFTSERSKFIVGAPVDAGRAWRILAMEIGHWEMTGCGMFCVTMRGAEDKALGLVGPWAPGDWPEPEVGWQIWDTEIEGTGIATEAARACVSHAYRDLGWNTVVSYIAPENTRSIRLAEKLGAVLDPDAPQPKPNDDPCLVYRHPKPERAA